MPSPHHKKACLAYELSSLPKLDKRLKKVNLIGYYQITAY